LSKKDKLSKEIDELLDEIRFFRNILFGVVSGLIGIIFSYSQNAVKLNFIVKLLLGSGGVIVFILMYIIYVLKQKKHKLHNLIEKEE